MATMATSHCRIGFYFLLNVLNCGQGLVPEVPDAAEDMDGVFAPLFAKDDFLEEQHQASQNNMDKGSAATPGALYSSSGPDGGDVFLAFLPMIVFWVVLCGVLACKLLIIYILVRSCQQNRTPMPGAQHYATPPGVAYQQPAYAQQPVYAQQPAYAQQPVVSTMDPLVQAPPVVATAPAGVAPSPYQSQNLEMGNVPGNAEGQA